MDGVGVEVSSLAWDDTNAAPSPKKSSAPAVVDVSPSHSVTSVAINATARAVCVSAAAPGGTSGDAAGTSKLFDRGGVTVADPETLALSPAKLLPGTFVCEGSVDSTSDGRPTVVVGETSVPTADDDASGNDGEQEGICVEDGKPAACPVVVDDVDSGPSCDG